MIKESKGFWISVLILFVLLWWFYGIDTAYQRTLLFAGDSLFIVNVIIIYLRLKDVCFVFSRAATKKEWIRFIVSSIIIWSLFFTLKSYFFFWMAVIIPIIVLTILLIYDLLVSYIKKI